jgi:hypothetical protein
MAQVDSGVKAKKQDEMVNCYVLLFLASTVQVRLFWLSHLTELNNDIVIAGKAQPDEAILINNNRDLSDQTSF